MDWLYVRSRFRLNYTKVGKSMISIGIEQIFILSEKERLFDLFFWKVGKYFKTISEWNKKLSEKISTNRLIKNDRQFFKKSNKLMWFFLVTGLPKFKKNQTMSLNKEGKLFRRSATLELPMYCMYYTRISRVSNWFYPNPGRN